MRFFALSTWTQLFLAGICVAQTIDVKSTPPPAVNIPQYRPALVGRGPNALINQIDSQELFKNGQKDAAVCFSCLVRKNGDVQLAEAYRATADAALLQQELLKKLAGIRFLPAIYNQVPVDVIFYGTVVFKVVDFRPRLRIFSNQETEDVNKESDFVAPQPVFGSESKFTGWHYPPEKEAPVEINAEVELVVDVSDKGVVNKADVINEDPPFVGFGEAALRDVKLARFIPGFRGGVPIACKSTVAAFYKHKEEVFDARLIP
jgi:hypothetical protein